MQDHVAWSEPQLPEDGARIRDNYLAQAQAKYGESFGLAELLEILSTRTSASEDLRQAITSAFAFASAGEHGEVGVEHLLLALLDNPAADDVLTKCGADTVSLRRDLQSGLEAVTHDSEARVSRELFGVLCRAGFYRALGRDASNAANVLVGMFAESCLARELLQRQGIERRDVIRYLAHGIPKALPSPDGGSGVLSSAVEAALRAAYEEATEKRHEAFGVDHLLLALMDGIEVSEALVSPAQRHRIRLALGPFVETTPRTSDQPRPTRALNRAMQQAVARARRNGDTQADADSLVRAIALESGTRAADILATQEDS